jgi:hypothetical protein
MKMMLRRSVPHIGRACIFATRQNEPRYLWGAAQKKKFGQKKLLIE